MIMEEKDNTQVEGYLQKRFQAGIVKVRGIRLL